MGTWRQGNPGRRREVAGATPRRGVRRSAGGGGAEDVLVEATRVGAGVGRPDSSGVLGAALQHVEPFTARVSRVVARARPAGCRSRCRRRTHPRRRHGCRRRGTGLAGHRTSRSSASRCCPRAARRPSSPHHRSTRPRRCRGRASRPRSPPRDGRRRRCRAVLDAVGGVVAAVVPQRVQDTAVGVAVREELVPNGAGCEQRRRGPGAAGRLGEGDAALTHLKRPLSTGSPAGSGNGAKAGGRPAGRGPRMRE